MTHRAVIIIIVLVALRMYLHVATDIICFAIFTNDKKKEKEKGVRK